MAAVWVEVAGRGEVTVDVEHDDGRRTTHICDTFTVHGHHYALVDVEGLTPGGSYPYTMAFRGERIWPEPDSPYPASRIRTLAPERGLRLVFGSCRTSVPHDAETNRTHGPDVLRAYGLHLHGVDEAEWPSLVLLLGDQVYADETSEAMQEFIAARRDIDVPPGKELKDYEEYAHLYTLAWTDPANRWLLSTLSTAMMFDDHDIRDDWNTSAAWRDEMRRTSWWQERIVGGLASYWVYQHIGNLSRAEREVDAVWSRVLEEGRDGDAGTLVDDVAARVDRDPEAYRWSFHRSLGGTRLVMLDTRCARVLDEGRRRMLDNAETAWLEELLTGDVDHLLIGTSLPFLLPVGLHHLEAWDEAVASGAWGSRSARVGERIRQGVDLEHWAAFQTSFHDLARSVMAVARGERGRPPAVVAFLSGDVHHSYLAEADLGRLVPGRARLLQAVCSPIRNPLPRAIRFASATSARGLAWPLGRLLARSAKVADPPFRWSITDGPWFDNALATLDLTGRHARLRWETAEVDGSEDPVVVPVHSVTLT
ncbi:MAG: alkaline phosphatase family protein [Propionibacteriales bacterium]|nr:alkaline phosphatase family protein [Propionibacteriales bacterium]